MRLLPGFRPVARVFLGNSATAFRPGATTGMLEYLSINCVHCTPKTSDGCDLYPNLKITARIPVHPRGVRLARVTVRDVITVQFLLDPGFIDRVAVFFGPIRHPRRCSPTTADVTTDRAAENRAHRCPDLLVGLAAAHRVANGTTDDGATLTSGTYTLSVSAVDSNGNSVDSEILMTGVVSALDLTGDEAVLYVNGVDVSISDVQGTQTVS